MKQDLERRIEDDRWRHHSYPVNQMFGKHPAVPAFLVNQHRVDDLADAEAYIARLRGVRELMSQLVEQLQIREAETALIRSVQPGYQSLINYLQQLQHKATAYKIGMLRILEECQKAQEALAAEFDIREFHDVVLRNGAVPMDILGEQVDAYINRKKALARQGDATPAS
jgi:uncharacterized protein (DUF885 family)